MTMYEVYKLCKALVGIYEGEDYKKAYKGSYSKAKDFVERYEANNSKYIKEHRSDVL